MTMKPRLRKFALTAHITFSVGWLGAVVAYLALAIAGLTSHDAQMVRPAYLAMELIGWFVIVPLSVAALLTGLVQSLGTEWGLFRHYWILAKFLLTTVATVILLLHMPSVSRMSGIMSEVVHAGGGLLVLLATTTLSVYKPWGMTRHGRRQQYERRKVSPPNPPRPPTSALLGGAQMSEQSSHSDPGDAIGGGPAPKSTTSITRWVMVTGITVIVLILLVVILHVTGTIPHGR